MPVAKRAAPAGLVLAGQRARVYRNLRNDSWSVKINGWPVFHVEAINLYLADFFVSPSGRELVRVKKQRSVHAWCTGQIVEKSLEEATIRVSYDPYGCTPFFTQTQTGDIVQATLQAQFTTATDGKLHCHVHPDPF